MSSGPVAVVTGANAGIGLALCEQLLASHPCLHLCLACRNKKRAEKARAYLQALFPDATIDVVNIDTSSVKSVLDAAKVLKEKYTHIDFLYLNAGVMQAGGVRWNRIISGIFSSQCVRVLTTGEGLIVQQNSKTPDGLMNVFATNLFGHYVLLRELEPCLGSAGAQGGLDRPSQLIWTSSSNAQQRNFSLEDMQHEKGEEPYSSSKYATDMLNVALNEKYNKQDVYSHSTCPGLVMTNLTDGILPAWVWWLVLPFMLLMRILVPSLTNSPSKGAASLLKVDRTECTKLLECLETMRKDLTKDIVESS
ncbi:3-keto-steroid reductase/17-beta-hydroxysteroid dehydrogenase 7-like isoform X2 [Babylonia areolata]|uniref:3-keto-steroid reductase/17-beta-hydroxysteroid dehydrogenase 7-like isoform X2 n=1 Tax=Babylonia areolata TaxID=304850 RepID=UPI003FD25E0C